MDINIKKSKKDSKLSLSKITLYITLAVYSYIIIDIILVKSYVSSPMELFSTNREMLRGVNLIPFNLIRRNSSSSP